MHTGIQQNEGSRDRETDPFLIDPSKRLLPEIKQERQNDIDPVHDQGEIIRQPVRIPKIFLKDKTKFLNNQDLTCAYVKAEKELKDKLIWRKLNLHKIKKKRATSFSTKVPVEIFFKVFSLNIDETIWNELQTQTVF